MSFHKEYATMAPALFTIREATSADADAMAHVMIAAIRTAFLGIVPDQYLNWITPEESAANWQRDIRAAAIDGGDCFLVAEDPNGTVVGLIRAGPRDDDDPIYQGEVMALSVSPSHQHQGIGRALVRASVQFLASSGIHSLLVQVLSSNPNRPFYEQLGGKFLWDEPYDWDGFPMTMATYGWTDTAVITAAER
jgi:predicted N-acetyltransferase YhbS